MPKRRGVCGSVKRYWSKGVSCVVCRDICIYDGSKAIRRVRGVGSVIM